MNKKLVEILIAEDEEDQRVLLKEVFKQAHLDNPLHFVCDGEELMDFLKAKGKYSDRASMPLPGLILLDLNMPKKDGRAALEEIKTDKKLRPIPIVVMTTSHAEEDIALSYDAGANCFITKPVNFKDFINTMLKINQYWLQIVQLPNLNRDSK